MTILVASKLASLLDGYIDHEDGTILDLKTNLIWQQEGPQKRYTWQQAKEYCKSLSLAGYTDWRLPTIEELKTLIDRRHKPTICPVFQCYDDDWYWSSYADVPDFEAWFVHFIDGYVHFYDKRSYSYVRAVHSAQ